MSPSRKQMLQRSLSVVVSAALLSVSASLSVAAGAKPSEKVCQIRAVGWSDAKTAVSVDACGTIRSHARNGKQTATRLSGQVRLAAVGGSHVAVVYRGKDGVEVRKIGDGSLVGSSRTKGWRTSVALSRDGTLLVEAVTEDNGSNNRLVVSRVGKKKPFRRLSTRKAAHPLSGLVLSADGKLVAGHGGLRVTGWATKGGAGLGSWSTAEEDDIASLAFSASGDVLLVVHTTQLPVLLSASGFGLAGTLSFQPIAATRSSKGWVFGRDDDPNVYLLGVDSRAIRVGQCSASNTVDRIVASPNGDAVVVACGRKHEAVVFPIRAPTAAP